MEMYIMRLIFVSRARAFGKNIAGDCAGNRQWDVATKSKQSCGFGNLPRFSPTSQSRSCSACSVRFRNKAFDLMRGQGLIAGTDG
jgi:hypothetical protein